MVGLAAGAAVALMVYHGVALAARDRARARLRRSASGIVNGLLVAGLRGNSFIMTLGDGDDPDRARVRLHEQATRLHGRAPGVRRHRAPSRSSGSATRSGSRSSSRSSSGSCSTRPRSAASCTRSAATPRRRASRASARALLRIDRLRDRRLRRRDRRDPDQRRSGGATARTPGQYLLLPAYAGAFLGAACFRPGEFNIPGTVVGVLFLGTIQTGLTLLNLQTYLINLVQGAILIVAVLLSTLAARKGVSEPRPTAPRRPGGSRRDPSADGARRPRRRGGRHAT